MTLLNGKHVVKEIQGIRCSVAEDNTTKERVDFLKSLLELNGHEVLFEEIPPAEEGGEVKYIIGVKSIIFNPVIAVYQRILKTKDDKKVTPDYWNQKTEKIEPNYWDASKK